MVHERIQRNRCAKDADLFTVTYKLHNGQADSLLLRGGRPAQGGQRRSDHRVRLMGLGALVTVVCLNMQRRYAVSVSDRSLNGRPELAPGGVVNL